MNEKRSQTMNEQEATVNEIVRSAREGGLTGEVLGKILEHRLGAVNCYPGQPTHTCHQIAYFIALEGRMGHQLQLVRISVNVTGHFGDGDRLMGVVLRGV